MVDALPSFVESVQSESCILERIQRAVDVLDADDRQKLQGAGGGFRGRLGQSGGTALGNDDRRGAGGVGRAHDGAQIVRVFDAVQHDDHGMFPGFRQNLVQRAVAGGGGDRQNPLMPASSGEPVESGRRLEAQRDAAFAAGVDERLQTAISRSLRHRNVVDCAARAQRRLDCVDAHQTSHRLTL